MMSFTERTSISGTALSYLLKECVNSPNRQEGFLFGNITENVTNHISDSRTDNARVEIQINVTSMLPVPETGLFYSSCGLIKEDVLDDILDDVSANVVGWYHFRQNNCLKPTLRDKLVSKSLHQYFSKYRVRYFLYCNITSKLSLSNSTHTYSYRFYKVNRHTELEPLVDITNNLGENVSGYKRTRTGDQNDEFNKAVMEASKDGSRGVAEAVRMTLEKAATDAAQWEVKCRELSSDITCMLAMLANHYQANQSNVSKAIVKEEEQQIIKPLVEILSVPTPKKPEPFDFVNDIIKNNLKPNKFDCGDATNSSGESVNNVDDAAAKTGATSTSNVSHKRVHSDGPACVDMDPGRSNSPSGSWDIMPPIPPQLSTSTNSQQSIPDV